jgi:hypothetical protein
MQLVQFELESMATATSFDSGGQQCIPVGQILTFPEIEPASDRAIFRNFTDQISSTF